ncbi:hypothetical protein CDL12_02616 [Handroanthus impetiginosus]|uniref:Uncharacterized protein n=1 Tax=Handroanthus impetiginosus TaxID=429701 RepID=A0A2G9I4H1_9LAMI|nr:hypothetical protein CDL12_02616 [Handroanthus impetiginosus]
MGAGEAMRDRDRASASMATERWIMASHHQRHHLLHFLAARADHRFLGSIVVSGNNMYIGHDLIHFDHDDGSNFFNLQQLPESDHDFVDDRDEDDEPQDAEEEERRLIYRESQQFLFQYSVSKVLKNQRFCSKSVKSENVGTKSAKWPIFWDQMKYWNNNTQLVQSLRQAAVDQLCSQGFNASLCISKWNRTHKTPAAGTQEYIQVMATKQGRRKQIPSLYNKLIHLLPQIYIGKSEHMNAIVRLVCGAAKKSSQEQNIHMGPWRRSSFMLMKWLATSTHRKFLQYR